MMHDAGEHADVFERRRDGDRSDDVGGDEQFESEQDRSPESNSEALVGVGIAMCQPRWLSSRALRRGRGRSLRRRRRR